MKTMEIQQDSSTDGVHGIHASIHSINQSMNLYSAEAQCF